MIDTALPSPQDIVDEDAGPIIPFEKLYPVAAHSMIVLISQA